MLNLPKKSTVYKWPQESLVVLDLCRNIHTCAEELYLYLADIHREQREIARMWGLLAIDKCNHSDVFNMASRLKGEGISEINCTDTLARNILAKLKSIPKDNRCTPPSIEAALKFMVKLEEYLADVHVFRVVKYISEQDMSLLMSTLKSSATILHMLTEEYINLTVFEADSFE